MLSEEKVEISHSALEMLVMGKGILYYVHTP